MQLKDCYYLGSITKAHGLKGHLIIRLDTDQSEIYKNLESVFVEINGSPVPFFLSETQLLPNDLLRVKFKDINFDFQSLIGKDIYLPLSSLPPLNGKKFYFHEIIGFNLVDAQLQIIGKIIEINDHSPQTLFLIELMDTQKEIYIPIINEWILEVNRKDSYISMCLPDGILNL